MFPKTGAKMQAQRTRRHCPNALDRHTILLSCDVQKYIVLAKTSSTESERKEH